MQNVFLCFLLSSFSLFLLQIWEREKEKKISLSSLLLFSLGLLGICYYFIFRQELTLFLEGAKGFILGISLMNLLQKKDIFLSRIWVMVLSSMVIGGSFFLSQKELIFLPLWIVLFFGCCSFWKRGGVFVFFLGIFFIIQFWSQSQNISLFSSKYSLFFSLLLGAIPGRIPSSLLSVLCCFGSYYFAGMYGLGLCGLGTALSRSFFSTTSTEISPKSISLALWAAYICHVKLGMVNILETRVFLGILLGGILLDGKILPSRTPSLSLGMSGIIFCLGKYLLGVEGVGGLFLGGIFRRDLDFQGTEFLLIVFLLFFP